MSLDTGHFNSRGDMNFLQTKFTQNMMAGEKLMGHEFEMTIDEYPDLAILVRTAQFPAMGRSDVEDWGPMGLGFDQYGALENKGEIAVTCVETLGGRVLEMMREVVREKKYLTVTIRSTPESLTGKSAKSLKFKMRHCKLRSDVIDLSTEDQATLVKPPITIKYNWVDL